MSGEGAFFGRLGKLVAGGEVLLDEVEGCVCVFSILFSDVVLGRLISQEGEETLNQAFNYFRVVLWIGLQSIYV